MKTLFRILTALWTIIGGGLAVIMLLVSPMLAMCFDSPNPDPSIYWGIAEYFGIMIVLGLSVIILNYMAWKKDK